MLRLGKKHDAIRKIKPEWKGNTRHKGRFSSFSEQGKHGVKNPLHLSFDFKRIRFKSRKKEGWKQESLQLKSLDLSASDFMVWLGHNSFYISIGGKRILIDPVFGGIPFVRRIAKMPADKSIFTDIDYILLSHDHYDHMDKKSIKTIEKQSNRLRIICGKGTEKLLGKWVAHSEIIPLEWYDKYIDGTLKITFLPSAHWSKRGFSDGGKRLWGAFMVRDEKVSLYFSGDTTYDTHFRETKELFEQIDYAMIGIGAYRPHWLMERNHLSPREAIMAAIDMEAGQTIPMHYGTFDLSRERYAEPLEIFRMAAEMKNVNIATPNMGEIIRLKPQKTDHSQPPKRESDHQSDNDPKSNAVK